VTVERSAASRPLWNPTKAGTRYRWNHVNDGPHGTTPDEYLTVLELAARLKLSPKTVRNRMHDGTWVRGEHWFRRPGIGPRFRWSALVAWLEGMDIGADEPSDDAGAAYGAGIQPARRNRLPQATPAT
jgi:hypothetical protein